MPERMQMDRRQIVRFHKTGKPGRNGIGMQVSPHFISENKIGILVHIAVGGFVQRLLFPPILQQIDHGPRNFDHPPGGIIFRRIEFNADFVHVDQLLVDAFIILIGRCLELRLAVIPKPSLCEFFQCDILVKDFSGLHLLFKQRLLQLQLFFDFPRG